MRHYRELGRRCAVSAAQFFGFYASTAQLHTPVSGRKFSISVFWRQRLGSTSRETGSKLEWQIRWRCVTLTRRSTTRHRSRPSRPCNDVRRRALGRADAEPAARLHCLGDSVAPRTSADFGLLMKSDVEKWARVIQSANIRLEQ
jgi:hypothetical protein